MTKQQKQVALVAAGAIVLYLVYRWYSSNNSASSSAGTAAPDTSGSDYASLAGQEQGDVAALQGQEQSDVSGLQGQEQSDVAGLAGSISSLTGSVGSLAGTVDTISTNQTGDETSIAALASGQTALNRAILGQISTKPGGAFYKYYVNVTGHAPPAQVKATNFIYQAWKGGVHASAIAAGKPKGSKPTPHPSAPRQTQVAHPNANHTAQNTVKPKPSASKPPPRANKPKASGRRK